MAAAIAVAAVVVAFLYGAPVAGGSDSYGYVSQAHLWATGRMREELRLVDELVPAVPVNALVPLGYNLAGDGRTIVPTYAAGLPLVMALFERLAGARAVFWVGPLLAGLAVWSTFLLGRAAAGAVAGVLAAMLLATSSGFLFQMTAAPMSDLPAAAWWTLALALLFVERRWAAPIASLAAALAILTRPNLVPVAVVPLVCLLWRAVDERRSAGAGAARPRRRDLVVFAAGVVAACAAVAWINARNYGSPLSSGYDVKGLFALEHAPLNLVRYPALLTVMQTPLVWLAVAAPWFQWRRRAPMDAMLIAIGMVAAVFACYFFYPGFDGYATMRFLVPGLPALFVLLGSALALITTRLPPLWRTLVLVAVVATIGVQSVRYAREGWAFDTRGDLRFAVIGRAVAQRLPQNAVILAMQHSGSVRYYSGRETVRYDLLPAERLDRLIKRLRRLDRPTYILLDEWEVPEFKKRFEDRSTLGSLDWPPLLELDLTHVRIWDAKDRARRRPPRTRETELLPWPYPR